MKKLNIILVILICLLLPINVLAVSYGKTGAETNFDGDVGVPANFSYYVDGVEMVKFSKWDATVPPTADNDISEGYKPGSTWIDLTGDRHYVCLDNTDGDAIWEAPDTMWVRVDEAIKKGDPVYISGAQGTARPKVMLVDADDVAKIRMIGVAVEDIDTGDGFIRIHGAVKGLDTSTATGTDLNPDDETWAPGDILYATRDGNGGYTNVRPTSGRIIKAAYTLLGDSVGDTLFVLAHVNATDMAAAAGEDIRMRLGADDGSTDMHIKNFSDELVASIDDQGDADFNSLIVDVEIADAEISDTLTASILIPAAEVDMGAHSVGFTLQTAAGDGATLINWTLGNKMKFTFGAQGETITFTNPSNPGNLLLLIVQDGGGSRTITWSGMTIKWAGGTAPTLTTTGSGEDIISFFWDGSSYYGVASLAFATP